MLGKMTMNLRKTEELTSQVQLAEKRQECQGLRLEIPCCSVPRPAFTLAQQSEHFFLDLNFK